jgi:AmmeMemoRadiSam system protein B
MLESMRSPESRATSSVRPPAVAGVFYPGSPGALAQDVQDLLSEVPVPAGERPPKALIAPHAGYPYSGPVAASAYARIGNLRGAVSRVVLLGPAHRVALRGLAAPAAEAFETPLGRVPIDRGAVERALALPQVRVSDRPHAPEHSLEVHLPFLQTLLGEFWLVPFVVGDATPEEVEAVLDLLWGGPETLVVVSSDLSHDQSYATARRMDAETSRAIEALDPDAIRWEQACGRIPVQGLLRVARRRGLSARAVDVRNSVDTAGGDRVVGYGSYVVG